ncbi:MAG: precorrin-6A reductase [Actinomycetota bacterium]|nr:precorrin-6A reductase [Actinomycetota bacterium]
MILVLGGTTEGRRLAGYLSDSGFKVMLSTATTFPDSRGPAENPPGRADGVTAITGMLDRRALACLIDDRRIRALVDATHPFALEITKLARSVCEDLNLPYLRFERAREEIPGHPDIILIDHLEDAPGAAAMNGGNIFLATGVKSIERFANEIPPERVFARVLPWPQSLDEALKWLPPSNVIAALGPFTREFNVACFNLFNARILVTKNSGAGAGMEAKISAALELKMKVVIIDRPHPVDGAFTDFAALAARLEGVLYGAV